MASKVKSREREPVIRPPVGWRKPMPLAVKLQVIVNQRGLDPAGQPLDPLGTGVHFDHRPPLHEREYDEAADETLPAANDIGFIVAISAVDHRHISRKDVSRMRKTERQRKAETTFSDRMVAKRPGERRPKYSKIPGRAKPRE